MTEVVFSLASAAILLNSVRSTSGFGHLPRYGTTIFCDQSPLAQDHVNWALRGSAASHWFLAPRCREGTGTRRSVGHLQGGEGCY